MERIEENPHESRGLRRVLRSLKTILKNSLRSTHRYSKSNERDAFASYLFRMQIYRQHDEVENLKKAANRTSKATRSREAACAVRPWYKDDHSQQDYLPQLRPYKSRRDRIKARVIAISPSKYGYRALKKRVKTSNTRKRLTLSFMETSSVEQNCKQCCIHDEDEGENADNKILEPG